MTCKYCGCSDERACSIPMQYDVENEYILAPPLTLGDFTVPCHWVVPGVCSDPACVDKAYAADDFLAEHWMVAA